MAKRRLAAACVEQEQRFCADAAAGGAIKLEAEDELQRRKADGAGTEPLRLERKSATVGGVTIQGVQRGMNEPPKVVASQAHETEKPSIYAPGDHVMHRKFGRGAVVRVSGSGSDARIMIRFDDVRVGVKELALTIAPMIRLEE